MNWNYNTTILQEILDYDILHTMTKNNINARRSEYSAMITITMNRTIFTVNFKIK